MDADDFIDSLETIVYHKLKYALSPEECRRILKQHLIELEERKEDF